MGSVGKSTANAAPVQSAPIVVSYDIEDRAEQRGYDSAAAMVEEDLTAGNDFWTRDDDMVADVEDLGYSVVSSPNGEYFTVIDENDESDSEFIVYYETAGSSRYITRVRKS